ncbi:helix-turn-helix domain-containing protein [Kitasatospora purpeofusca]|uniref:helix-turn-helix domain-containing protein n=1 Tax=Kitasatospora purpeofusca TaxID=67352 RepID=UPI00365C64F4
MAIRNGFEPVTDADYQRIRELHAQGLGRNEIMKATGRGASVVSRLAREMGLQFTRGGEVATATAARQADNKARRGLAVQRLYDRVERIQDRLDEDDYRYQHVTHTGLVVTVTDEYPPAADEKHLASAVTGYLNAAARLEAIDAGDGADDARSMLGKIMTGLADVYREQQEADTEGAGDDP